ncbi:MAG: ferritin-like domain-containing protein [Planctomycetota bacterium]|jgi:DNA-binding ferritin-like protein
MTATTVWKPQSKLEANPIGLSKDVVASLAPQLDEHVAALFTLFHQYQKHHWLVEGPQFRDIHVFLEEAYNEVHLQVDAIAERMTALGAVPTSGPARQAERSYIEHEPEGVFRLRDMLERDRNAECVIAQRLRTTIDQCTRSRDYGSETLLKQVLLKVEGRAHHLHHYLGDDSLEIGITE